MTFPSDCQGAPRADELSLLSCLRRRHVTKVWVVFAQLRDALQRLEGANVSNRSRGKRSPGPSSM